MRFRWKLTLVLPWKVDGRWGWLLFSTWGTRKKHRRFTATCANWYVLPEVRETVRKMQERDT